MGKLTQEQKLFWLCMIIAVIMGASILRRLFL